MTTLEFIEKKARPFDGVPYAVMTNGIGWKVSVLKRYAKDDTKEFARWFCAVDAGYGYGPDYGDTYVSDIVAIASKLLEVDGRAPTDEERQQFQALKRALAEQPGGILIGGGF